MTTKYRFPHNSKTSTFLSRDVSCRFEPVTVAVCCVLIGLRSVGVGTSPRYSDNISIRYEQCRLKNKMAKIQCNENANIRAPQINRSQGTEPSREQVEREFKHYANTIRGVVQK